MIEVDKLNTKFDLIADVFSSYNLNHKEGILFVDKVYNQLKKGGIFFLLSIKKFEILDYGKEI